jgi:hypothetical protein
VCGSAATTNRRYSMPKPFTGKDDAYVDVEQHLAAAMARD